MFILTNNGLFEGILGQKGSSGISLCQMVHDASVSFLGTEIGIWCNGMHNDFAVRSSKWLYVGERICNYSMSSSGSRKS